MKITIERCVDARVWARLGREANADHPEYAAENVLWPVHETPENRGTDLSVVASVGRQLAGRLQRRGNRVLEVSVVPNLRGMGVGSELFEFAVATARTGALTQVHCSTIDDDDQALLGFLDHLQFAREPEYSMIADLAEPIPDATQARSLQLIHQGFKYRVLDQAIPTDLELAQQLQTRYFPGYPAYISEAEMVRLVLQSGMIVLVAESDSCLAGFVIGGSDMTMKNGRFLRTKGFGLLGSIATSEQFRQRGVASAMMCEFRRLLQERGMRRMLYGGCGPEGNASRKVAQSVGARQEVRHFRCVRQISQVDF